MNENQPDTIQADIVYAVEPDAENLTNVIQGKAPIIIYAVEPDVSAGEVADLYRSAALRRPVDDLPRIARMLREADLIVCARHEGRLVGIARALTDWSFCCYLSDLAVHADYQRQGIGRSLTARVREAVGEQSMVLLLAAPQARDYYAHIGFDKADNAWILPRKA